MGVTESVSSVRGVARTFQKCVAIEAAIACAVAFPSTRKKRSGKPGTRKAVDSRAHRMVSGRRRVLIVEDEPWIAMDLERLILDAGYEVAGLAHDADEALHIAEETHPAVVLMDIRLAGTRDGIDAAQDVYRRFGIRSIFVSAHFDGATRRRAEAVKPHAMLDKPIEPDRLIAAIRKALGGH
jgi:two-component system, response regulator PdtaR